MHNQPVPWEVFHMNRRWWKFSYFPPEPNSGVSVVKRRSRRSRRWVR